jgi:FxLD family lantipeptide
LLPAPVRDGNCYAATDFRFIAPTGSQLSLTQKEIDMQAIDENDVFALDLSLTDDAPQSHGRACTTNDGCDPTCASSCVTHNPN